MPLRSQEPQGDEMSYCGAGAESVRDDSTVHNIPKNYLKWAVERERYVFKSIVENNWYYYLISDPEQATKNLASYTEVC